MHDLSLYLLDILENSLRAGAGRIDIGLYIDLASDSLRLTVDDDGGGLSTTPEQTLDPFYTTKPGKKTGLGLSLLRGDAQAAGGDLVIGQSATLGGVKVEAHMGLEHVDRPPVGDMATTILVTALTNPEVEFRVSLGGDQLSPPLDHAPPEEAAARLAHPPPVASPAGSPTTQPSYQGVANMTEESNTNGSGCEGCCGEISEEELLRRLDEVIERYKDKPGALIPVLQQAQGICGYLPESALKHIAKQMKKPYSEVAGVVGFYSFFSTVPRGKHVIRVCLGTACYVRGGLQVLDAIRGKLGIDVGETTEDRMFSLEVARCFGACGLAPAVSVDEDVHRRVRPSQVSQMLAPYYAQEEVIENVAS